MHLLGWTNPLQPWTVQAINDGLLTIHEVTIKNVTYQFLYGTAVNDEGTIISFL